MDSDPLPSNPTLQLHPATPDSLQLTPWSSSTPALSELPAISTSTLPERTTVRVFALWRNDYAGQDPINNYDLAGTVASGENGGEWDSGICNFTRGYSCGATPSFGNSSGIAWARTAVAVATIATTADFTVEIVGVTTAVREVAATGELSTILDSIVNGTSIERKEALNVFTAALKNGARAAISYANDAVQSGPPSKEVAAHAFAKFLETFFRSL